MILFCIAFGHHILLDVLQMHVYKYSVAPPGIQGQASLKPCHQPDTLN